MIFSYADCTATLYCYVPNSHILSAVLTNSSLPVSALIWSFTSPHFSFLLSSRARSEPKWSDKSHQTLLCRTSGSWSSNRVPSVTSQKLKLLKLSDLLRYSESTWWRMPTCQKSKINLNGLEPKQNYKDLYGVIGARKGQYLIPKLQ